MKIDFRYPNIGPVEVPDRNLLGVFKPKTVFNPPPASDQVRKALAKPLGSPRLSELASKAKNALILTDDFTRPTPAAEILPGVLDELQQGGLDESKIEILIAAGTHRPMTRREKEKKLGEAVVDKYRIYDHNWQEQKETRDYGKTSLGIPIVVDRRLGEADLVVAIGHIVPHRITGFSGGSKIIYPGLEGPPPGDKEIHWLAAQRPGREILGVENNFIRHDIDEMGRKVGLSFIVNVVQDNAGHIIHVVAGDMVQAHQAGVERSKNVYGLEIPQQADIVITDSYPADVDFWQAAKAVYAMELAVREDGVVIVVTPCPEGVSKEHPEVMQYGVRPVLELQKMVKEGKIKDIIGAAIAALTAWVVKERAKGIMVSPGIDDEDKRKIGFEPAGNPQEALEKAFAMVGREAKVLAFHHGGEILPLVRAVQPANLTGRSGSADRDRK